MAASRRAKQFAPFDALKGLKEAIAEKERIPSPRRILAEDAQAELNEQLSQLRKGTMVTVVYYCTGELVVFLFIDAIIDYSYYGSFAEL